MQGRGSVSHLLRPTLLRPRAIPAGEGWAFELKRDGFARSSQPNGLEVRSRRNWRMTDRVPELDQLLSGLVLDGELVAFEERRQRSTARWGQRGGPGLSRPPLTLVLAARPVRVAPERGTA